MQVVGVSHFALLIVIDEPPRSELILSVVRRRIGFEFLMGLVLAEEAYVLGGYNLAVSYGPTSLRSCNIAREHFII